MSAVTDCAQVRTCISPGPGINYDPATGVVAADVSNTPGNNLTIDSGGLFVPTGAATVSVGCGLSGDGSASTPVAVNADAWGFTCPEANARPVYCLSDGSLATDPAYKGACFGLFGGTAYPDVAVPAAAAQTIESHSLQLTNPDPCRNMLALVILMADVDFRIPPNGSAAFRINNDRQFLYRHSGSNDIGNFSEQHEIFLCQTIPAGGSVNATITIAVGEGSGGATYDAISWGIRAIAYAAA
ncbi:hypothetical protein [Streptomyces sp. NPDC006334]|uniref:hypothetical protein n=1 Tax=Streptomyces sp. NPDC006334 TaxID=3156754 RepID=UPI0033BB7AFF